MYYCAAFLPINFSTKAIQDSAYQAYPNHWWNKPRIQDISLTDRRVTSWVSKSVSQFCTLKDEMRSHVSWLGCATTTLKAADTNIKTLFLKFTFGCCITTSPASSNTQNCIHLVSSQSISNLSSYIFLLIDPRFSSTNHYIGICIIIWWQINWTNPLQITNKRGISSSSNSKKESLHAMFMKRFIH